MVGLPKSIIKKYGISKKAWRMFRGRKKSRAKPKTRTVKKRGVKRRMARRRRGSRGKNLTGTAMKFIRIGALAGPGVYQAVRPGSMEEKVERILRVYTGYSIRSGSFDAGALAQGWGPYLMSVLATYGIPKLASIIRRL